MRFIDFPSPHRLCDTHPVANVHVVRRAAFAVAHDIAAELDGEAAVLVFEVNCPRSALDLLGSRPRAPRPDPCGPKMAPAVLSVFRPNVRMLKWHDRSCR